jgi:glutathione synthase/RimK-type ligase-like ATP-grasp enzyme
VNKKGYASNAIRGKLRVCRYMSASQRLKALVPRTVAFSASNLEMMCSRYEAVYVKPDIGSLGKGISRVRRVDGGFELTRIVAKSQVQSHCATVYEAYRAIVQSKTSKLIIQKAVQLDLIGECPYDIRAMVQRKPGGAWTATGFMVKIGGKGKIVTNYHQGGDIWTLGELGRQQGLSKEQADRRIAVLSETALAIARTLAARRSGMYEMGIDFAYDRQQRLWVLEVNSNHPQFHPLRQLNPAVYRKMKRFAASYGRYAAK